MSLVALRSAIVSDLDTNVAAFKTVQAHGGRFNRDELNRIAIHSPAALVAVIGGPLDREGGGQAVGDVTIAVFIVTRGVSTDVRDSAVLTLVEAVAARVVTNAWDYDDAQAPTNMQINNLYSGKIDNNGVALWSVSWQQRADLAIFDDSDLDWLHALHVDYDLVPADGTIDFQQIITLMGEFMSEYGHINVSTAAATSVAVAGTYVKAAGTTELNLSSDNVDMPANNRLRHTGTVAKPFIVKADLSVTVAADAKVTAAFAKGGTVDTDTAQEVEATLAGGAQTISLNKVSSLATNEYEEVWITAGEIVAVTVTKLNVSMGAT